MTIGTWPTPIRYLTKASEVLGTDVFAKLENACGVWGGNKVRKLEYVLAEATNRRAETLVAYGAGASSWVAATVLHATRLGFEVRPVLAGDVPASYADLYDVLGVEVNRCNGFAALPAYALRARLTAGPRAILLPPGGSGAAGDVGSVWAGIEIATAVRDGSVPKPSRAVVALGTGGTTAGLAVGLALGDLPLPIVAARVVPRPLGTRALVKRRIAALLNHIGHPSLLAPPVIVSHRFFGGGYGHVTSAGAEAIELAKEDGLELEPTYGAKAFAELMALARSGVGGPLLFLHTSPGEPEHPARLDEQGFGSERGSGEGGGTITTPGSPPPR
ncbi:MAG: pyridoxal-phosphate dependent enzyme [Actinomycetota bacterium]|nr:pyridoxal-phosphate dependent enzyme [Actinomycetota bacterium]